MRRTLLDPLRCNHRLWTTQTIVQNRIANIKPHRMERILQCALTDLVEDNPQPSARFLQDLLVAAEKYQVPKLKSVLEQELIKQTNETNATRLIFEE